MAHTVLTERNHYISLTVAGQPILDPWMQFEGGDLNIEETKLHPGGMADPIVLTSTNESDNVTITREYQWARDAALLPWFRERSKEGQPVTVSVQDLDPQTKQGRGAPDVWTGRIVKVGRPQLDSQGTGAQVYSLEIAVGQV